MGGATELTVEDFFGHEQYGITSDRPLSADYHAGDTILVADAQHATARVLRVSDSRRTVQVTPLARPPDSWKLTYIAPLPAEAPGLARAFLQGRMLSLQVRSAGHAPILLGALSTPSGTGHTVSTDGVSSCR